MNPRVAISDQRSAVSRRADRPEVSSLKPQASSLKPRRRRLAAGRVTGAVAVVLLATFLLGVPAAAADPPPVLTGIDASLAYTCGERYVYVYGLDIQTGATVRLTQASQPDIVAWEADVIERGGAAGGFVVRCRFDLTPGTPGGFWSVVLTNPDDQSDTLIDALEVVSDCPRGRVGDLYACSVRHSNILQFDGLTGEFVCIFTERPPDLWITEFQPFDLAWAPNGNLWVVSNGSSPTYDPDCVAEYDGQTGAFVGYVVPPDPAARPSLGMSFGGPNGNLYLPDQTAVYGDEIWEFDRVTHQNLGVVVSPSPPMEAPGHNRFTSYGTYLVLGQAGMTPVPTLREYDGTTFAFIRDIVVEAGAIRYGVIETPDGCCYLLSEAVMKGTKNNVEQYDIATGAFLGEFIPEDPCLNPPPRLPDCDQEDPCYWDAMDGPVDLAYGPNGHLYVSTERTHSQVDQAWKDWGNCQFATGAVHEFDPQTGEQIQVIGKQGLQSWPYVAPDPTKIYGGAGIEFKPLPGDWGSSGSAFGGDWAVDLDDFTRFAAALDGTAPSWTTAANLQSFDFDRDNDIDLADFAAFQRAFGTSMQTGTGACCNPDGTCTDDVWGPECAGGGVYQGDETTCGEVTCPPTGACCLPDGTCEDLTSNGCDYGDGLNPGVYQGDYTECAGVTCPFGACCFASGECAEALAALCDGTYQGDGTTCAGVSCPEPCGDPFVCDFDEGEPWCPAGGDNHNGGCNSDPPVFQPIACGQTVCGTAWAEDYQRDLDWYELVLTETTQLTWTVEAEFAANVWIMDGNPGCDGYSTIASATGTACETITISAPVLPGTYWLLVGPSSFEGAECDMGPWEYAATVECGPVLGAYSNEIDPMTSAALAGAGLQLADDLTLEGEGARDLVFIDLRVYGGNTGGGDFDVTVELWDACPGNGGSVIPNTTFNWTGVPDDGYVWTLVVDPLSPAVTIPDTVWMVATFSTPESGWIIAEHAETGATEDRYGWNDPWNCNATFGGFPPPHAGLWANLRCVEGGAKARSGGTGPVLRMEAIETPVDIQAVGNRR